MTIHHPAPTARATVRTAVEEPVRLRMRYDTVVKSAPHEDGPPSQETIALLKQLGTFCDLPKGWDGYGADPFDEEELEIGKCVLHALDAPVTVTSLTPGSSGELEFAFEYNGAQVTLLADDVDLRWVVRPENGGVTRHFATEHVGRSMWEAIADGLERIR